MKREGEQLIFEGVIGSIEVVENKDTSKSWKKRATIKVEDFNGQAKTFGTFEETDIETVNSLNGKAVKIIYKVNESGGKTYNNIIKGGIGPGDAKQQPLPTDNASKVVEETVVGSETPDGKKQPSVPKNMGAVAKYKEADADKYALGMAFNGAATLISGSNAEFDVDEYDKLSRLLFERMKVIRKDLLGY